MENILIIKTNATGDVLRTTVLLHILKGKIFWITAAYNIPIFPDNQPDLILVPAEDIHADILNLKFDLVINLEEDIQLAQLVNRIDSKKKIGVYWNNGKLDYSDDSAEWFDMSLISRFSASQADELKIKNKFSYQDIICRMIGKKFSGQSYILYTNKFNETDDHTIIGIEERVGSRWPNKYWNGYGELKQQLRKNKYEVLVFEQRPKLRQYMDDIRQCSVILTGDTLAMHIALGYKIPCIAIFNCTSPIEIYDYGILQKITSPILEKVFYNTTLLKSATEAISVGIVLEKIYAQLRQHAEKP